jgi:hypothetical protein
MNQKSLTECTYMNGAADERFVAVAMLHLDKELLLLSFVALVTTLTDIDGFIDPSCEVHQGISCLTTRQCLIATSKSGKEGEEKIVAIKPHSTTRLTLEQ